MHTCEVFVLTFCTSPARATPAVELGLDVVAATCVEVTGTIVFFIQGRQQERERLSTRAV